MELILKGIVTGFILSIMIGPVFFVLLETSITKGIKAAIALDLGVLVNDVVYVLIAFVFYNQVAELTKGDDASTLKLIGGVLFVIYGVVNFFKKVKETKVDPADDIGTAKGYFLLGLKGFLLNLANPMVIFYWFSVLTLGAENGGSKSSLLAFVGIILFTFFSIDFLKIIGAKKLRPLVTRNLLVALNKLIGTVFVGFGIVLIIQGVLGLLVTK
ncbi:MAG: LysE family transporter [Crocinitomicaceae bacterium]|nr:LysE family translocator [Crocinitomicaceae bacterium]|tara:strand:+ start:5335 stop:5976 length:642 start_codon:yes stop_codon:yes gene_type:complete